MPAGILMNPLTAPCDAPEGLTATIADNNVTLSWNGTYSSQHVTLFDDVEGHEYGAINSPGTVGWDYIDGDGLMVRKSTTPLPEGSPTYNCIADRFFATFGE